MVGLDLSTVHPVKTALHYANNELVEVINDLQSQKVVTNLNSGATLATIAKNFYILRLEEETFCSKSDLMSID